MKIKILIAAMSLLAVFTFANCGGNEPKEVWQPKEIETTEFNIYNGCWNGLKPDSVYIFNSYEELAPYAYGSNCLIEDIGINFNDYSFIVVTGQAHNGIENIQTKLLQNSLNGYKLFVELSLNATKIAPVWTISLLVSKLSQEAKIELIVNESKTNVIVLTDEPARIVKGCFEYSRVDSFSIELENYPQGVIAIFPSVEIPKQYQVENLEVLVSGNITDHSEFNKCLMSPEVKLIPTHIVELTNIKINVK